MGEADDTRAPDGPHEPRDFDFEIPVVASRREFFEQEAVVSGPGEDLESELVSEEVVESLKSMREEAGRRAAAREEQPAGGEPAP